MVREKDYEELYERQYGEKMLRGPSKRQFLGLRKLLKKYDWDRYTVTQRLIEPGNRVLDIGCGEGFMLRKLVDNFNEFYDLDIAPSRLQEAEDKVTEFYPSEVRELNW